MKYPPGSFSKNFAWHGTGLRKLHTAIGHGFNAKLAVVPREVWRNASKINDAALELIPVNFFLHNKQNKISVDELVFQALKRPHSIHFDRLSLFALHLNRVGGPPSGVERPIMWANEFVREQVWRDGVWQAAPLADAMLDAFVTDRLDAQPGVRVKCRNNYRHLFELCGYWPTRLPIINSGPEHWLASALFLAWDRLTLDHGPQTRDDLSAYVKTEELHKLIGVSRSYMKPHAKHLASLYLQVGALNRFGGIVAATGPVEIPEEKETDWIEQEESDEAVKRRATEVQAQVRDRKKAASLKVHYDNTCMVCSLKLQVGDQRFYSEAAHIKPLGKPHNGPDKISNMLVLCPNHHLQFDLGVLRIRRGGSGLEIVSRVKGDPLNGVKLTVKHSLDEDYARWHYDWFRSKRP